MELPSEIQTRIERIALLSPSARKVLETDETALTEDSLEWDPDSIRQEVFIALVNDLEYLGIYFSCTIEEAYGPTWKDFDELMSVLDYIFPNRLYPKLVGDKKLRTMLQNVMWGISDEPLLQTWLQTVSFYNPQLGDACCFCQHHMNASALFSTLLENMNSMVQEQCVNSVPHEHDALWEKYKTQVVSQAHFALDYLSKESDLSPTIKAGLEKRLSVYLQKELDTLEDVDRYKFIFTTPKDHLSPEGEKFWKKLYYEFCVSNKLLPEYYIVRHITPSYQDVLGILIYQFASTKHAASLTKCLEHVKQKFPHLNENFDMVCKKLIALKETLHDRSD